MSCHMLFGFPSKKCFAACAPPAPALRDVQPMWYEKEDASAGPMTMGIDKPAFGLAVLAFGTHSRSQSAKHPTCSAELQAQLQLHGTFYDARLEFLRTGHLRAQRAVSRVVELQHAGMAVGADAAVMLHCSDAVQAVLDEANARAADIIAVGTHQRGMLPRLAHKSVAATIIDRARRSRHRCTYQQVLIDAGVARRIDALAQFSAAWGERDSIPRSPPQSVLVATVPRASRLEDVSKELWHSPGALSCAKTPVTAEDRVRVS